MQKTFKNLKLQITRKYMRKIFPCKHGPSLMEKEKWLSVQKQDSRRRSQEPCRIWQDAELCPNEAMADMFNYILEMLWACDRFMWRHNGIYLRSPDVGDECSLQMNAIVARMHSERMATNCIALPSTRWLFPNMTLMRSKTQQDEIISLPSLNVSNPCDCFDK